MRPPKKCFHTAGSPELGQNWVQAGGEDIQEAGRRF
jgi:hypothetical protein